jgi:hypothetical protein
MILSVAKRGRSEDLRREGAEISRGQGSSVDCAQFDLQLPLHLSLVVNGGSILDADVVALAHPLRQAGGFPKQVQQSR